MNDEFNSAAAIERIRALCPAAPPSLEAITPALRHAYRPEFLHASAEHQYRIQCLQLLLAGLVRETPAGEREIDDLLFAYNRGLDWLVSYDPGWVESYAESLHACGAGRYTLSDADLLRTARRASGDRA